MNALAEGADPSATEPPSGALVFARELARRGISLAQLLRAYRIGQARFTSMCLDAADDDASAENRVAMRAAVDNTAAFIDHVCERVTVAFEDERERWITSRSGLTQHWITQILTGAVTDTAQAGAALDYPLDGGHLVLAVWVPETERTALGLAAEVSRVLAEVAPGSATLTAHTEPSAMNVWITVQGNAYNMIESIRGAVGEAGVPFRAAIGLPGIGIEGFRAGYRQAAAVKALARTAVPEAPTVVSYADIAPIAMLTGDLAEMRGFVAGTLGALAEDTQRTAELRETLRVHLACNRSPALAASRTGLHRNTIRYRIQQAADELGHDLDDVDPFTLAAALEICRWYGHSVLAPRGSAVTT
ncbi:MAG: helix-turn-helix domain-containing protein [Rhodococcus sp. (in: high G+C Gram-positive bacteria)]